MSAVFGAAPLAADADGPPPILTRFIEMLNTQNWSLITEIISPDYAPAYSHEELPTNRAELQQHFADDWVFSGGLWEPPLIDLAAYAERDDYVFFLAELTASKIEGGSIVVPYFGYFVVKDGMIVSLENSLDRQVRGSLFGELS